MSDNTELIAEALKVNDNHYDFCTPGCPHGDHDHQPSLTARLVTALIESKRDLTDLGTAFRDYKIVHPEGTR